MQGLVLFGLLAAFMWGERVRAGPAASAVGIVAAGGRGGRDRGAAHRSHSPWVDYRAWAGTTVRVHVDTFNWNQTYGPLRWPQSGHEVFTVEAGKHGDYWKAEDLDTFNGYRWVAGLSRPQPPLPSPSGDALARWTQTLHVSIVRHEDARRDRRGRGRRAVEPARRRRRGRRRRDVAVRHARWARGPATRCRATRRTPRRISWRPPGATTRTHR